MADKPAAAQDNAPRCPLGFTGTPPVGHPTIPGFSSATPSKSTSTTADSAKTTALARASPYKLLLLDGVFLLFALAIAYFWPEVARLVGPYLGTGNSASTASGATQWAKDLASKAGAALKQVVKVEVGKGGK